jgi:Putative endonuclease, protein of unknown function (DUF1780)
MHNSTLNDVTSLTQSEADQLALLIETAKIDRYFFSSKGKEERERWVVSEFLKLLPLDFSEVELQSDQQSSKTDVVFREGNFQVKEIVNPGMKRNDEISSRCKELKAAKSLQDIVGHCDLYDVPSPTTIYSLVTKEAHKLANDKYMNTKSELDLLFYVTRTHASLIKHDEIDKSYLASLGWRSISCLAGNQAIVIFAQSNAPVFLHSHQTDT